MTLEEYGAWFVGFSESMPAPPGLAFWDVIKERVSQVDGLKTTPSLYNARYWQFVPRPGEDSFCILKAMEALGRAEASRISTAA